MNGGGGTGYMQAGRSGKPVNWGVANKMVGRVVNARSPGRSGEEHPILEAGSRDGDGGHTAPPATARVRVAF